ncbi:hypothetical protein THIOM_004029 [Candidatus Thiomargarita nelsonii]|uniref:Uncharacterized protein n=1 Tax=Candidatus Thiomargarita nelsonii TaxID=1003181 RepID=A0A176RX21_9GAMM|nr:hypothetical protein THIOM_004029 [Candidatus Thiomargarita nelsonii]
MNIPLFQAKKTVTHGKVQRWNRWQDFSRWSKIQRHQMARLSGCYARNRRTTYFISRYLPLWKCLQFAFGQRQC